jgi:branched-chain amino acid transport system permease protein
MTELARPHAHPEASSPETDDRAASAGPLAQAWTLVAPLLLAAALAVVAGAISDSISVQAQYALASLVMVVGLQTFVGNSGVLSFGHVAFVAVGAWTFGLTTIEPTLKHNLMPELFPALERLNTPTWLALTLSAVVAMLLALLVGPLLLRLNGLQAGIATFALLGVTTQVFTHWAKIGPPSGQSMVGVRAVWGLYGLLSIALVVTAAASTYRYTRSARLLRASRENITAAPGAGIHVTRHRVIAFVLSAGICGVGGAMWAETNAVIQASQLSVGLTFTIIAMLVLGGTNSVWGAAVGVAVYSVIDILLVNLQSGIVVAGYVWTIPDGTRPLILGAILILMLLFRPLGITGGREFLWPSSRLGRRRARNASDGQ